MSMQAGTRKATAAIGRGIGRPPFPREHGAWVILYCSLFLGLAAAGGSTPARWLLVIVTVTGAFLTREAAGLLLRRRGGTSVGFWFWVYMALFLAGALPLLFWYRVVSLLLIGGLAALLFAFHSALLMRGRLDRSQWGEILGVGALALTAPAGYATAAGRLDGVAWLIWAACLLYFSSGIFMVKMFLSAAKWKRDWSDEKRRAVGRQTLQYHLILAGLLILFALRVGGSASAWVAAAYLPALFRALKGWSALTPVLPPLKRVGIQEAALAIWFTGCLLAAVSGWRLQ